MTAHPEVLVQLRKKRVADAEGCNAHRRLHKRIRVGEEVKVRRSPQAAAGRKRDVEELGRPHRLLRVGSVGGWYTALEAREGKPGHGTMPEPQRRRGTRDRQAEEYGDRESPPDASGESSHAVVLRAWESHVHGEGRDGRTQPAQDTCAGHRRTGSTPANLPAGHSRPGESRQAAPMSGPVRVPERRAPAGLLGRPEQGRGQWGGWRDVARVWQRTCRRNVEALVERLKQKRYRAKLIRRHYIPKGNGQERPLGIPVIEDKLLQAACARILKAIYAQEFLGVQ